MVDSHKPDVTIDDILTAPRRVVEKLAKLAKVSFGQTTFLKARKLFLGSGFLTICSKNKGNFRKFFEVSLALGFLKISLVFPRLLLFS